MLPTNLLCYYPTTVAIVDDSNSFLAMINNKLNSNQLRQLYSNPEAALHKINTPKTLGEKQKGLLKSLSLVDVAELEAESNADILVDVDLKLLHKEIYNPKRFDRISAVVVDYSMPNMNGIEFCRSIKDKTIKKIMITAISDYRLAVQAFNEKIIDKFILKNTPNLFAEINASITNAQYCYFSDTYGVDSILGFVYKSPLFFDDSSYKKLLATITTNLDFVEYYVLDTSSSVLFLSAQGNPTWFIVKTKEDLDELYGIACDNKAPANIIAMLRDKQAAPILLSEKDHRIPVAKWNMCKLKKIPATKKYYYAVLTGKAIGSLNLTKITSFEQSLSKKERSPKK
jgi:CheY-like chemotaxis protein